MTTTIGHNPAPLVDVLRRADQRWATRQADERATTAYLEHLARYVQPLVDNAAPAGSDHELSQLRAQVATAEKTAAARQGELDQAHAEITDLRTKLTATTKLVGELRADYESATHDTQKLADQLEELSRERDQLTNQLRTATAHQCTWEWPSPNEPVKDCTCGRPYPRHAPPFDTEEIKPDREPWADLFDRIRDQLTAGTGGDR